MHDEHPDISLSTERATTAARFESDAADVGRRLQVAMNGLLAEVPGFVATDDARLKDFGRDTVEASGCATVIGAHATCLHYANG